MKLYQLFIVCVVLKVVDFLTTYVFLDWHGSLGGEANPIVRWVMYQVGVEWAIFLGSVYSLGLFGIMWLLCHKGKMKWPFYVVIVMLLGVDINNLFWLITW